jgi:hypothetical protein
MEPEKKLVDQYEYQTAQYKCMYGATLKINFCQMINVVDPQWFYCGSGSSFLSQSGSREANQCGSRSGFYSDFKVTKS